MKINLYVLFVISFLFATGFCYIFPPRFLHISLIGGLFHIALFLNISLMFYLFGRNYPSNIPKYIHYIYIIMILYFGIQFFRTVFLYPEQRIIPTIQVQLNLLFGTFMYLVPVAINSKQKLNQFLNIIMGFSFVSFLLFVIQVFSGISIIPISFITTYSVGSMQLFKFSQYVYPFFIVFASIGVIFYYLNKRNFIIDFKMLLLVGASIFIVFFSYRRTLWLWFAFAILIVFFISSKSKILKKLPIIVIVGFLLVPLFTSMLYNQRMDDFENDLANNEGTWGYRLDCLEERYQLLKNTNNLLWGLGLVYDENDRFDYLFEAGGQYSSNKELIHQDMGYISIFATLGYFGLLLYGCFIISVFYFLIITLKSTRSLYNKSILVSLIVSIIWLVLQTLTWIGMFGLNIIWGFIAVGLCITIKNMEAQNEKT